MQKKKALIPYFIFLLPVFFILNGYNDYFGFFPVKFAAWNFAWVSVSVFIIYLIGKFLYRQNTKAVAFGFFVSAFFIFFGSVFDTWKAIANAHFLSSYYFVVPVVLIVIALFSFFLKRYRKEFLRLFTYLNFLFFALMFFEVSRFVFKAIRTKPADLLIDSRFTAFKTFEPAEQKNDSLKPDIFLLIFDAMPSSRALKEELQFSNHELDTFLQQQGFYIAEQAKSNYDLTVLSVSSMLNMDYVSKEEIQKGTGIDMYYRATSSILDNSFVRILNKEKYTIHQFQPLTIFNNKDWEGNLVFGNMSEMSYFYKTFPGRLYRDIGWNYLRIKMFEKFAEHAYIKDATEKKDDIERSAQLIQSVCSKNASPKFVYAHFMLPHIPFVFTPAGDIRPFKSDQHLDAAKRVEKGFTDQLKFANLKIAELVGYIKEHNKKNTIIIVQGDHGFKSMHQNNNADFGFQNLNAVYFPDGNYDKLYPGLSPVNSFRIVLNKYFSSQLPLLKDSCVLYEFSKQDWEK